MGTVYEVLHRDTQRKRAMKVLLPHVLANDDMRDRFKREGIVTAGIESEHLVEVFDIGVDETTKAPFLVMELLRGEDLGARLSRRERTKPSEVLAIVEQVVRALERTHAAHVVHRDLKPENLFATRRDDGSLRIKILDFGIAKFMDGVSRDTASVGSPLYMAPEQTTGEALKITPATDLYSLGQIVFTMLVGTPYFQPEDAESTNMMQLLMKVFQGTTTPATVRAAELGVSLPVAFDAWFSKATALDAEMRHQSASELLSELQRVLHDAPEELPSSSAKRRVAAFQPTQPLLVSTPPDPPAPSTTHVMARSAADLDTDLATAASKKSDRLDPSHTVPSVVTKPRSSRALAVGLGVVIATAGVVATRWAVTTESSVSTPSVESRVSAGTAAPTGEPSVTPSTSPPGSAVSAAPSSEPLPTALSTAVASAVVPGASARSGPRSTPTVVPTSKSAAATPSAVAPSTVWQGSRR
jgi:eukaryotic-like serine/threonine-protein kinase